MRHLTQHARTLRRNMTDAEQLLWRHLRNKQLNGLKFRRQQPIGSYIVDFVCFEKKLVIEVDGGYHSRRHGPDARRDEALRRWGYHVLRLDAELVVHDLPAAIARIREELARVASSLEPR